MRLAGPLLAALAGLLVVAFFSPFYDGPGNAARRGNLIERLKKVEETADQVEKYEPYVAAAEKHSRLPSDVPMVDARSIVFAEHVPIDVPDGITIEPETVPLPNDGTGPGLRTKYTVTNSTAKPLEISIYLEYCTDDDFVIAEHYTRESVPAGEHRSGQIDARFPHFMPVKVDIRALETR